MSVATTDLARTLYQRSPKTANRRRSLFPTDNADSEGDSDLGHISPLSFDSSYDEDDLRKLENSQTMNDYDIIGVVENENNTATCSTPSNSKLQSQSEIMSPLYLSPHFSLHNSSPSCILKTPHDSCNTNCKLPKLARKSLLDSSDIATSKRKLSPTNSPNSSKLLKLDTKNSKVRTTLFPKEDIFVPVKSFYSNSESIMDKILEKKRLFVPSPPKQSTQRRSGTRRRIGEINAGVKHKIRKPKQRKSKKIPIPKASDSAALTDFILTLKEMRKGKTELIENKENCPESQKPDKLITPAVPEKVIKPAITEKLIKPAVPAEKPQLSKKRTRMSESEPDSNKKFFKFTKSKGVVSLTSNTRIEINSNKDDVITPVKQQLNRTPVIEYDPNDFSMEEPSMISTNIDNILSQLDDSDNKILLEAHSSVVASENSILLHEQPKPCPANLILSPISQMCDVTSGLALSSPKKAKNLTSVLEKMPSSNSVNKTVNDGNLYPIFYPGTVKADVIKLDKNPVTTRKKFTKVDEKQMLLDAGQKRFGVIQCPECGFVYHLGDPMDEQMHLNYHEARHILKFAGWKNERVVAHFEDMGRIIQILPGDPKSWIKRANDLFEMVNHELGCFNTEINQNFEGQIYLYIKNKFIVGCVLAVQKQQGYRMLTLDNAEVDLCSNVPTPIKCGIAKLWVSHNHRKQGIAKALIDVLKRNFMYGYVLNNSDIAMSAPTKPGIEFARKYFDTPNFLIYLE